MNKRVKYGLPGLAGAFTLSSGVTGYWCQNDAFWLVLLALVGAATISTMLVVFDEA